MDNISDGDQISTWKPTFRKCLLSMGQVEQTFYFYVAFSRFYTMLHIEKEANTAAIFWTKMGE